MNWRVDNPSQAYNPEFMKRAVALSALSLEAESGRGPFGAIIVYNGEIVAEATNEVVKNNDPTCHGEINCIRQACQKLETYDLTGAVLYTSSEPCPMCLSACIWANICTVYYANTASQAGEIGFRDDHIYRWLKGNKAMLDLTLEHHPDKAAAEVFKQYKKQGTIY